MKITESELEKEKDRLQMVYKLICAELQERTGSARSTRGEIVSMRKNFWDSIVNSNEELENVIEIAQKIDLLDQEQLKYERKKAELNRLFKLKASPYFGRIDFTEKASDFCEKAYIGLASYVDYEKGYIYIYDWRSPVSSIFYEFELGPAEYESPEGLVQGDISLKRQFKIHDNIIDYMFDSSIKIDDEILQEILGKSADDKMKNIVTTIQKEQNRIIRDDKNSLLIVQGAAGSGKTSIALHRVAYLLYKHRNNSIYSQNIVIFSPNQMFNDYISNVLPELGEENINQTTFHEYIIKFIDPRYRVEDMSDQMEYVLSHYMDPEYNARIDSIKYKSSGDFLKVVKKYADHIVKNMIEFEDIIFEGELILSKEEMKEMFNKDLSFFPAAKRLAKIRDRIYYLLNPVKTRKTKELQERLKLDPECLDNPRLVARLKMLRETKEQRDKIEKMTALNVYDSYVRLYEDKQLFMSVALDTVVPENIEKIMHETLDFLNNNIICYEDAPAYLYLLGCLEGFPDLFPIRHVVIDEAQDYSPLQYEIFHRLFPYSNLTILGDLNQSINPYLRIDDFQTVLGIFNIPDSSVFELYKSYRSVKEIVEFSKGVLPASNDIEYINRSGEKPSIIKIPEEGNIESYILKDILKLQKEGFKSIAVICKTEVEEISVHKKLMHEAVKNKLDISIKRIDRDSEVFTSGTVVIPSYLSKGLEFDAVIIYDAGSKIYFREEERRLFYTICTRALHRLHIFYKGTISKFIPAEDNDLYKSIEVEDTPQFGFFHE